MTAAQTIAQLDDTQNDDHIEPCASAEAEWDRSRYEHSTRGWRWTAESLYRFKDGSWLYVIDGGKPQPLTAVPLRCLGFDVHDCQWIEDGMITTVVGHALMDARGNAIAICDDDADNATELTHGWGASTR